MELMGFKFRSLNDVSHFLPHQGSLGAEAGPAPQTPPCQPVTSQKQTELNKYLFYLCSTELHS